MVRMNTAATAAAALMLVAAAPTVAEDFGPARFGPDDERGALNLLGPEKTLEAIQTVREGKTYSLALVTGPDTPGYPPRYYKSMVMMPAQPGGITYGRNELRYMDEFVTAWPGVGTHFDGFAHITRGDVLYNDKPLSEVFDDQGVKAFGVETIPPIVTRGVVLNVAGFRGVDMIDVVPGETGHLITVADLEGALAAAGTDLRPGDAVMVHTGWLPLIESDPQKFISLSPGLTADAGSWLAQQGVAIVCTDQWATDAVPFEDPEVVFPVHQIFLVDYGVHHIQNCVSQELVDDGVTEFMFTLGVTRWKGLTQMNVHPIGIR
ncbi:MAG: cyclase family protein [Pseudomonadota bacterium]